MRQVKSFFLALALVLASGHTTLGMEAFSARIQVSNEALYDYVVIGERPEATEGYDNAYDTVSPGSLSASMGEGFISTVLLHPDWKPALQELRGDMRPVRKEQKWLLVVTSSLEAGANLHVGLKPDRGNLPEQVKVFLREECSGKAVPLSEATYLVKAPGKKNRLELEILAEQ